MYKKAVVVLGCGIDSVGKLNQDAENSVRLAIDALEADQNSCLVMTGSISYKATFRSAISEAQAMKDYATSLDVSQDKIFVEAESKDTLGNFYFTKLNLLMPLNIHNILVIRGPNHSDERIEYLATKVLGNQYTFSVISPDIVRPEEQAREKASLTLARKWLDPIDDGDMLSIYRLMRDRHPGYNSSLNLDSLKKLL